MIATEDERDETKIKSKRDQKAFGGQMKQVTINPSYCVAIREVRRHIPNQVIVEALVNDNYRVEYLGRVKIKEIET